MRYSVFPYQKYLEMKSDILERIPTWKENRYLKSNLREFERMTLTLLEYDLGPAELSQMVETLRHYYINT